MKLLHKEWEGQIKLHFWIFWKSNYGKKLHFCGFCRGRFAILTTENAGCHAICSTT